MMGEKNREGRSKKQSNFMEMMQQAAFWCAALCTILMWQVIWKMADFFGALAFSAHLGSADLDIVRFALFGIIFMIFLRLAQAGWASSVMIAALFAITRLPIF